MQNMNQTNFDANRLFELIVKHQWRWSVPLVGLTAAATLFAVLKPTEWEASQALTIRSEAANNLQGPGKFGHTEERRTAQETVLELAQGHAVLASALEEVGPPKDRRSGSGKWPSDEEVDDFRQQVTLTPPKGAELGRTEVFHLAVRDADRTRAVALVSAVCKQLEASYQRLRDATATSMIRELEQAAELARTNLDSAIAKIAETETKVGEDLGDLRLLHESISGESTLQRNATEIREEIRAMNTVNLSNQELLRFLEAAKRDPARLASIPNRLIESHPSLRRLKDGLVDAQLHTASLLGRMSDAHPLALAARESEEEVRRQIRHELEDAIGSLQLEIRLNTEQIAELGGQLGDIDRRLERLAGLRAQYSVLVEEVENRAELLKRAEEELSQAAIARAGAGAASLLVPIDSPVAGVDPVGPTRSLIVLAGLMAGLLAGAGTMVLTLPGEGSEPRAVAAPGGSANEMVAAPLPQDQPLREPTQTRPLGKASEDLPLVPERRKASRENLRKTRQEPLRKDEPFPRIPERGPRDVVTETLSLTEALSRVASHSTAETTV